jgi:predicted CoA-binding protein
MVDDETIRCLLRDAKTIAVVGLSDRPERDSHRVAGYLKRVGYRIVPVNPNLGEVLGERCFPDLRSIPTESDIDIVDVFRRSEHVPEVMEQAISRGVRLVWLQLGVVHPEAERRATDRGLQVVSNRCIMVDHRRLIGE